MSVDPLAIIAPARETAAPRAADKTSAHGEADRAAFDREVRGEKKDEPAPQPAAKSTNDTPAKEAKPAEDGAALPEAASDAAKSALAHSPAAETAAQPSAVVAASTGADAAVVEKETAPAQTAAPKVTGQATEPASPVLQTTTAAAVPAAPAETSAGTAAASSLSSVGAIHAGRKAAGATPAVTTGETTAPSGEGQVKTSATPAQPQTAPPVGKLVTAGQTADSDAQPAEGSRPERPTPAPSVGAMTPKDAGAAAQPGIKPETAGLASAAAAPAQAPASKAAEPRAELLLAGTPAGNAPAPLQAGSGTPTGVPVAATPLGASAAAQVADAIKIQSSDRRIQIRLDPPELGHVRIELNFDSGRSVHAVLAADQPDTAHLLRRHLEGLEKALGDAGFEGVTIDFADGASDFASGDEARERLLALTLPGQRSGALPLPPISTLSSTAYGASADGSIDLRL